MMKHFFLGLALLICLGIVWAEDSSLVQWSNEYIRIFVTQTEQEMGRFAVDTTGGDPSREDDNNKPLIYGRPTPWTSYTTLQLDGKEWVFGGPTHRRAGLGGPTGRRISPPRLEGNEIVTVFDYDGLLIEQRIGPGINPYSGHEDSARIRYILHNKTDSPKNAGLRMVFDTMLGSNDGAPFRVGGEAITLQTHLSKGDLPDLWQAFDSLSAPSVIAQGVLKGYGVTPPDRVVFADWGTAADHLWSIPKDETRDFTRAGEDEPDTALILFWDPVSLAPGMTREITAIYGMGGITMAPGASFLGMAAPSEIVYDPAAPKTYQIMAYIENNSARIAKNVHVSLALPPGIVPAGAMDCSMKIPHMEPHEIRQVLWTVRANGRSYGSAEIRLDVKGDDLTPNSLARPTRIVGPPALKTTFSFWNPPSTWRGEPLRLAATVQNTGGAIARNTWVELALPDNLRLATGDQVRQHIGDLLPGDNHHVHWWLIPLSAEEAIVRIEGGHQNHSQRLISARLTLPRLSGEVSFVTAGNPRIGQGFSLEIIGERLPEATGFSMNISYDPKVFRLLRVAEGRFSMGEPETIWNPGRIGKSEGTIEEILVKRKTPIDDNKYSLVRIFLVPLRSGETEISIDSLNFHTPRSGDLPLKSMKTKIYIEEAIP